MEIELNLNEEDLQVLDLALSQLPYFKVVGLIEKINMQIAEEKEVQHGDD